ncbi:MAG: DoxX family protein [Candidatus Colwellbacteria bacterium]|nr:DoxX family protein [Candidatus Colwellbacteria bacterium]
MSTLFLLLQYNDVALLFLRFAVALVFLAHALPKLRSPRRMAEGMGYPRAGGGVFALGAVELASAAMLVLGFYAQLAAFALALIMVGAIFMKTVRWNIPFAAHDKAGWEFDLVLLAANAVILMSGGGLLSIFPNLF